MKKSNTIKKKKADEKEKETSPNRIVLEAKREAEFLTHVTKGEQRQAEKMLKKNRYLGLAAGTVTDHANRKFNDITGFQYAVWALDWHMWTMIQKYLPEKAAQSQAQGLLVELHQRPDPHPRRSRPPLVAHLRSVPQRNRNYIGWPVLSK